MAPVATPDSTVATVRQQQDERSVGLLPVMRAARTTAAAQLTSDAGGERAMTEHKGQQRRLKVSDVNVVNRRTLKKALGGTIVGKWQAQPTSTPRTSLEASD